MTNWMPLFTWIPGYQRSWIAGDLIAGVTIWAVMVPLAMAYAGIVGVSPIIGLYTIPLAILAYSAFGGVRLLVVGPDAAVAVLTGGIVAAVAVEGSDYLVLTVALALIVGLLYFLFFVLRLGWSGDLIPEPVLKGFVEGIVWLTILKQIIALLGLELKGSSLGFFGLIAALASALPQTQLATAILGATSVLALVLIRWFSPRSPGPIIVLIGSILVVGLLSLESAGVAVIGEVKGGLPDVGLPRGITFDQVVGLVPGALAIVVVGYTKSIPALKRAVEHNHQSFEPNRELLAIGASNIGAGLGGGYPIAGSLTLTAVSIDSGGRSQVANLVAGVLCVLTIVFLLPLLTNLAMCTLAAIIVVAIAGLSDLRYFRHLWSVSHYEFAVAVAALAGVLAFGVMPGVLIGVILAFFKLAYAIHSPVTAVVGRTPAGAFVDVDEHPEAREIRGMLIWRQYGPLVFLNARVLAQELLSVARSREDVKVIVLDATASAGIDTTAADALQAAREELGANGIDLWLVNPRRKGLTLVRHTLEARNATMPEVFDSLADAVARFQERGST